MSLSILLNVLRGARARYAALAFNLPSLSSQLSLGEAAAGSNAPAAVFLAYPISSRRAGNPLPARLLKFSQSPSWMGAGGAFGLRAAGAALGVVA